MSQSRIKKNIWDRDRANGYIFPYYTGDKVGIGTETPAELLDVRDGAIRVGYDSDTFDELIEFYRNGNKIGVIDNDSSNFRIKATNSNAVQVINDGNVGIQITDADVIDVVGVPTMSTAFQALVDHNNTSNKQGGTVGEYYHLTSAQHGQIPAVALTEGSVVFAGVGGVLSEDNANFFWDDTANELQTPTLRGSSVSGEDLTLNSNTSNDGSVKIGTLAEFDEAAGEFNITNSSPVEVFDNGIYTFKIGSNLFGNGTSRMLLGTDSAGIISMEYTGDVGIGVMNPTSRLHIKGATSDDTSYSLKVDNLSDDNLLSVRNDGAISGATLDTGVQVSTSVRIGTGAGVNDSSAGNNVSIGNLAGNTATTGGLRTLVGGSAGRYANASTVTAFGYSAGAKGATAFGYLAAPNVISTTAVAIGGTSLYSATSATNTSGLGTQSGRYYGSGTDALTIITNGVFLGADTRAKENSSVNEIVIGKSAIGNGSNTATIGNSSTTDTFLIGQLNLDNYKFPTADGTANQVLKTDGAGTLSWENEVSIQGYLIKVANYTVLNSDINIIYGDTDGGIFTITLPATPTDGIIFTIKNTGTSGNALTIDRNGNTIESAASDLVLNDNGAAKLQYTSDGWKLI